MKKKNLFSTKEDKESNGKVFFYENIYIWLWYYFDKFKRKEGGDPVDAACAVLTVLKYFNGLLLIIIIMYFLGTNYIKVAMEGHSRLELMFPLIILALILEWIDRRLYVKRINIILNKQSKLSAEKIKRSKIIFWCYFILTIASLALFPLLTPDI